MRWLLCAVQVRLLQRGEVAEVEALHRSAEEVAVASLRPGGGWGVGLLLLRAWSAGWRWSSRALRAAALPPASVTAQHRRPGRTVAHTARASLTPPPSDCAARPQSAARLPAGPFVFVDELPVRARSLTKAFMVAPSSAVLTAYCMGLSCAVLRCVAVV